MAAPVILGIIFEELAKRSSKGPWRLRQSPGNGMKPFIEARPPDATVKAYGLEVFGEDYTGFGDAEQQFADLQFAAFCHNNADLIIKLLGDRAVDGDQVIMPPAKENYTAVLPENTGSIKL